MRRVEVLRVVILLALALFVGWWIASLDARPSFDDSGLTAIALLIAGGVLGAAGPRHPWLWGLALGCWIPLRAIPHTQDLRFLLWFGFPLAGAYAGMYLSRLAMRYGHSD